MKYNKETPFEIKSEEDWKIVKCGWYVSYICNKCGERHVKKVGNLKCVKNTCLKKTPHCNKETPFEIKSEEDWNSVKTGWHVSYICNKCGERHVKKVCNLKNAKNTCLKKTPHCNKETPFEIKSEEDWKKINLGWWVSYKCNECGEKHIKIIRTNKERKNTCLNKTKMSYCNKETPFEIKNEEDWNSVKTGWNVSYICNKCRKRHVKKVGSLIYAKNTCIDKNIPYCNEETPFEIKNEEDWKKVKCGWHVSYICNKCRKRHVKKVSGLKCIKNTCLNKTKNIKINYHSNYVDSFIFAF